MKRNGRSVTGSLGLVFTATALVFVLGKTRAFAQVGPMFANPGGPVVGSAHLASPTLPPPPGVPGAAPNTTVSAPSAPALSGIDPTTELFEAINKGNLAAARDALGRGADLKAKSILGMTPLEDAVDLNRNEIAFLLLSIEHEQGAAAGSAAAAPAISVPPAPAAAPGSAATAAPAEASVEDILLANGGPVTTITSRTARKLSSPPSAARVAADPAPPAAALGQPAGGGSIPSIGFLGFGRRE